jgi:acetyl-CoA C-acetyltransferase
MPAVFGMLARAHSAIHGTTEEQMAKVRVKNSTYGALNNKAAFRNKVTLEEIMNSRIVVSPLKLLNCCANADGTVVLRVANRNIAKRITIKPKWVQGLGASSSPATLARRETYSSIVCTWEAAKIAYDMAGIGPEDIDVARTTIVLLLLKSLIIRSPRRRKLAIYLLMVINLREKFSWKQKVS